MIGLVVSSGDIVESEILRELVANSDIVICADGGLDHLRRLEMTPDLVIGDLDSISELGREYMDKNKMKKIRYPSIKDETDNELAVNYLIDQGVEEINFVGATGSRYDHSLINIMILRKLGLENIKAKVITKNNNIYYCKDSLILNRLEGRYTSIIALSDEGVRISLEGFLYPLIDEHIGFGSTRGISNEILGEKATIRVLSGDCLVVESKD